MYIRPPRQIYADHTPRAKTDARAWSIDPSYAKRRGKKFNLASSSLLPLSLPVAKSCAQQNPPHSSSGEGGLQRTNLKYTSHIGISRKPSRAYKSACSAKRAATIFHPFSQDIALKRHYNAVKSQKWLTEELRRKLIDRERKKEKDSALKSEQQK